MGFDPISMAALVASGVGAIKSADAAGDQKKVADASTAKAIKDASDLVQKQKTDRQNALQLGDAFSSLSSYQANSAGRGSTQMTGKLGLSGGGSF